MSDKESKRAAADPSGSSAEDGREFLTMTVNGQQFGIPVLAVQDVLGPQRITRVPLAPAEVVGALNLRGRIVTAIDLRLRLGLPPRDKSVTEMSVVLDHSGQLYSVNVDSVGEVLNLAPESYERNPSTLDARLMALSDGVYRLERDLLVVLSVERLLDVKRQEAA
ncbi:MAG: chemotaxis protein CheW [Alphaproteobacteria bacterium]